MATLRPHTNNVGNLVSQVSTNQDVDRDSDVERQLVGDVAPCGCIPSGVFRSSSPMRGRSNIGDSLPNVNGTAGDQPTQAGQRPTQAEAQIRAYFLAIAETSLA